MKKVLIGILGLLFSAGVLAQSAIIRGESAAGVYENLRSVGQVLQVSAVAPTTGGDPCLTTAAKSSAVINISAAASTQLVAISGSTQIYVCSVLMTISQVVTTANTLQFNYGTGASCGTGTVALTGAFGSGGVTAAPPLLVASGIGGTIFRTPAGQALCALTTIGGSANFTGVITYIQQ